MANIVITEPTANKKIRFTFNDESDKFNGVVQKDARINHIIDLFEHALYVSVREADGHEFRLCGGLCDDIPDIGRVDSVKGVATNDVSTLFVELTKFLDV